jgi:hypothetical protein
MIPTIPTHTKLLAKTRTANRTIQALQARQTGVGLAQSPVSEE